MVRVRCPRCGKWVVASSRPRSVRRIDDGQGGFRELRLVDDDKADAV
tara:strand:+ start:9444 stop:9584 length:141 start_codon:yes stop_codon:yes gene_type:complete